MTTLDTTRDPTLVMIPKKYTGVSWRVGPSKPWTSWHDGNILGFYLTEREAKERTAAEVRRRG